MLPASLVFQQVTTSVYSHVFTIFNVQAKARYGAVENTTSMGCNAKKTNNDKHVYSNQIS